MEDKFYAVIDTNVIVSAVISKSLESNPAKIIRAIVQDRIVPLFNDEILDEYREVLSRPKFHLTQAQIEIVLKAVVTDGLNIVTGNIKHFPVKPFVVTPTEMVKMMEF